MRMLIPVLAAAAALAGAAPAAAQPNYSNQPTPYAAPGQPYGSYQPHRSDSGPSASGDPWLNENDYDYNRRHWLPRNGAPPQYGQGQYDRRQYGQGQYGQGPYGPSYGNWNRQYPSYGAYPRPYPGNRDDDYE